MPILPAYPILLHLVNRHVLIVGGGSVAFRKAQGLLASGAKLTLIATDFSPELLRLKTVKRIRRPYRRSDMKLRPWTLAFAATDSPKANAAVQKDAATARILCCRCDDPEASDFSGAATAQIGPVTLAIGTSQASPALAARLRDQAAAAIDPVLADLSALLAPWREKAKKLLSNPALRRNFLQRLSSPEMESALRSGGPRAAKQLFSRWLAETKKGTGPFSPAPPGVHSRRTHKS